MCIRDSHLPSSETLLHDSGIVQPYGRDGPTFNGKGDLRRRSYESISDEDMLYEPAREEGSQERKLLYNPERLPKKDRKRRLTEYTDSSEEEQHMTSHMTSHMTGDSRPPPPSSAMSGVLGARTKHKKHKYSKDHKEKWRKVEHSKEGSSGSKHKHSHHHHKH